MEAPKDERSILLKMVPLKGSYEAWLLPVRGFPLDKADVAQVRWLLDAITEEFADNRKLLIEIFVQLFQFDGGKKYLAEQGPLWAPILGLGVWPGREPPRLWTREDFLCAVPGAKMRPPMYQVLRIAGARRERDRCRNALLEVGSVLQIMAEGDTATLLEVAKQVLLPPIKERSFRCFSFYIPLLDCESLQRATSEKLDAWLCGVSIYIRESFEDKGILILARETLAPILEKRGAHLDREPEPVWRIITNKPQDS